MLGTDVLAELHRRRHEVSAPLRSELDLSDPESVAQIAVDKWGKLDWCMNCAAYTAVDKAESEQQLAHELNALAPGYIASACAMAGMRLLHVSTDFVFDGESKEPYKEDDKTNPLGAYGRSKLEGELALQSAQGSWVIARTAWLYGPNGNSFPRTMIRAWEAGKSLKVVADQVGCPTYTGDLARVLVDLVESNPASGVYHTAGSESMSWHEFARVAIEVWAAQSSKDPGEPIQPIATEDWPTPAARPKYSVLSFEKVSKLGIKPMRPVREAAAEFCRRLHATSLVP